MGVRERMNESPKPVIAGVAVLLIAFGVYAALQLGGSRAASGPGKAYFTVDDGKTLFSEASDRQAPFDHEGKEAVRAVVFKNGSGEPFVGYLERFDKAKRVAPAAAGQQGGTAPPPVEVRRPGETKWVPRFSAEGSKVLTVKVPAGATEPPREVVP